MGQHFAITIHANTPLILSLSRSQAFFTSPSTSNGSRRFLAIGNFWDTTNAAYYAQSVSTISFSFIRPSNFLLQTAELHLYKYANAYSGSVPVSLYNSSNQQLGTVDVDNGDYDYDLLKYDLTESWQTAAAIDLRLQVNQPLYQQGIAICSGNSIDSVCPSQYHPQLELTYIINTQGQLSQWQTTEKVTFGMHQTDDFSTCQPNQGCRFRHVLDYFDLETNSELTLQYKNLGTGAISAQTLAATTGILKMDFALLDGSYELELNVIDEEFSQNHKKPSFSIDTTPPTKPVVLYQSSFGTRSGVEFVLDYQADTTYEVSICAGETLLNDSACPQPIYQQAFTSSNLYVTSSTPLLDQRMYHYVIVAKDSLGNASEPSGVEVKQSNMLLEFSEISVTPARISPANEDNKYDIAQLEFTLAEASSEVSSEVFNDKYQLLGSFADKRFTGRIDAKELDGKKLASKELASGQYYLRLRGKDLHGYDLANSKLVAVAVDNIAPTVYY